MAMKHLELTFAIIKPHIIKNPVSLNEIKNLIVTSKFKIVRSKRHSFSSQDAAKFYEDHKDKFFYNRLVTFMTSGPSDLYVLAKENAIQEWRKLMGPTKVFKAQYEHPNTIRGQFGLSDTRNATHGSDSTISFKREVAIFFPEFELNKWYIDEEPLYRGNELTFLENEFVHVIARKRNTLSK